MTRDLKTPLEMFYHWEAKCPDTVFLRQPKDLVWSEYIWRDVSDLVHKIALF